MKKRLCMLLCLVLLCCTASANSVSDIMTEIVRLSPEERADLAEALAYYMSLLGEEMPQPQLSGTAAEEVVAVHAQRYEHDGFSTPEDAFAWFLEGMKHQDLNQMLSAFALESYVDHLSMEEYLVYMKAWSLNGVYLMPMTTPLRRTANIELRRSTLTSRIRRNLVPEALSELENPLGSGMISLRDNDGQLIREFLQVFDNDVMASMSDMKDVTIARIDMDEWQLSERRKGQYCVGEYADRGPTYLHTDQILPMEALLTAGNVRYWICADAVCYEGKWHLLEIPGGFGTWVSSNYNVQGLLFTEDQRTEMLAELD